MADSPFYDGVSVNPLTGLLPTYDSGIFPVKRRERRSAPRMAVTPEEEESLARTLGKKALGSLELVGDVIGTPAAIVRNTLAGRNPLQGLFSPEDRTSGQELNRIWGVGGSENNWTNWLKGLVTEVGTDPLFFINAPGAALTKGGQVAKAAGLLDDLGTVSRTAARAGKLAEPGKRVARMRHTLGDLIAHGDPAQQAARLTKAQDAAKGMGVNLAEIAQKPLGGLVNVGIPFGPQKTLGTSLGGSAEKVARGLDRIGEAVRFGNLPGTNVSPGRKVAAVFDSSLFGTQSKEVQRHAPGLYQSQTAAKVESNAFTEPMIEFRKRWGLVDPAHSDELLRLYEAKKPADLQQVMTDLSTKYGIPANELAAHRQYIRGRLDAMPAEAREWGVRSPVYQDPEIEYFPRSQSFISKGGTIYGVEDSTDKMARSGSRALSATNEHQLHRKEFLVGIKGGTPTLKKIASDPDLIQRMDDQKISEAQIADFIRNKYGPGGTGEVPELYTKTLKDGSTQDANRYKAIAKWLSSIDKEIRQAGIFGNDSVYEMGRRLEHHADSISAVKTVADVLADEWDSIMRPPTRAARHPETKSLASVLKKLGIDAGDVNVGFLKKLAERRGMPVTSQTIKDLGKWQVRTDVARDLAFVMKPFAAPQEMKGILKGIDTATNYIKAMLTGPWPAFASRNFGSGQFRNASAGMFSPWSVEAAIQVARGKEVGGKALRELQRSPLIQREAAQMGLPLDGNGVAEVVSRLARRYGIIGRYQGEVAQRTGAMGEVLSTSFADELKGFPGGIVQREASIRPGRIGEKYLGGFGKSGTTWNPLKGRIRGAGGSPETTFAPVAAGEDINYGVELANRLSPWLDQIAKGVDPMVAKLRVGAAQVEYAARAFTPTERIWMTRLFPWYKFSSRQVPYVVRELWERPGGMTAQAIRVSNAARSQDPLLPEYVSETTAMPIGTDTPLLGSGNPDIHRYLTGFGLMHEDPLKWVTTSPKQFMLEALSRANPLAKAPLEYATGQSFFERDASGGRRLEDMDPVVGRLAANLTGQEEPYKLPRGLEVLAANSPLSRVLTTAKSLSDPRKRLSKGSKIPGPAAMVNALTGVRLSDVSPKSRDAVLRKTLEQEMKDSDARVFEKVYFPKGELAKMRPEEQARAVRMQVLMDMLAKRAKARAEEAKQKKLSTKDE